MWAPPSSCIKIGTVDFVKRLYSSIKLCAVTSHKNFCIYLKAKDFHTAPYPGHLTDSDLEDWCVFWMWKNLSFLDMKSSYYQRLYSH
jgi:hypothetical protein